MNPDFAAPQRQSKKGIIILALISYGKLLKNFWFVVLYILFKKKEYTVELLILLVIVSLVFVVINAYIKYQYFTYELNFQDDEFIIKKGVFNKKTILLEKSKIQEVNINQPFFHRILNIYQLEIDSPGTDKKEIMIEAISNGNAQYLRSYLLDRKVTAEENLTSDIQQVPQIKISISSLLKYAVTANYVKSFFALISLVIYFTQQVSKNFNLDLETYLKNEVAYTNIGSLSIFTFIAAFLLVAVFGILINVIRTFVVYYHLIVSKFDYYLSVEYGLFNTKNQLINKDKVQIITITQNYLQKKWNVLHLKFNQVGEENSKNNSNNILGIDEKEKNSILEFLYNKLPIFENRIKPNFRYIISRTVALIILPVAIGFFLFSENVPVLLYSIFYSIFAAVIIYFSFNNSRLSYNEHFIEKQSGIWDVEQKTFQIEKIQTVTISQYFWQKRSDLGNIFLSTAGGSIKMKTAKISELRNMANYCLYKVESSAKNWM